MTGAGSQSASPATARILVIEDDPVVRFNIRSYLEDSGFRVEEAEDGATGIEIALKSRPDLVLCDLRMPGMDGLDVLRRLHTECLNLPVVVVSGTGVLGDAVEALREGAWDFVVKPIQDMVVLEHAIEGSLERARLIRENDRYQRDLELANRRLREQLERIAEDEDAGRRIQLQLMPPAEQGFGEYRFSRFLLPSLYLSGDFVDYFVIDHRHLGFFLADVSGHGVSSAFVTVLLKGFVQRSLERLHQDGDQTVLDPLRMLRALNESIRRQRLDKYLTIFYGVIDCATARLHYANSGQFPSPLLGVDGTAYYLPGRGMPLGLFREPEIEAAAAEIPQGASLILCSDGVLESLGSGSLDERLGCLRTLAGGAPTTAEGLVERLGLDPDRAYPDDIALLAMGREERR
jgi:phosphoserine phosphatase RsbU/P